MRHGLVHDDMFYYSATVFSFPTHQSAPSWVHEANKQTENHSNWLVALVTNPYSTRPMFLHAAASLPFLSGPLCALIPNSISPCDACSCTTSCKWGSCCPHPALVKHRYSQFLMLGTICMETEATWSNNGPCRRAVHSWTLRAQLIPTLW